MSRIVGHCKECCKVVNEHGIYKCTPNDPSIVHLPKDKCSFCVMKELESIDFTIKEPECVMTKLYFTDGSYIEGKELDDYLKGCMKP